MLCCKPDYCSKIYFGHMVLVLCKIQKLSNLLTSCLIAVSERRCLKYNYESMYPSMEFVNIRYTVVALQVKFANWLADGRVIFCVTPHSTYSFTKAMYVSFISSHIFFLSSSLKSATSICAAHPPAQKHSISQSLQNSIFPGTLTNNDL